LVGSESYRISCTSQLALHPRSKKRELCTVLLFFLGNSSLLNPRTSFTIFGSSLRTNPGVSPFPSVFSMPAPDLQTRLFFYSLVSASKLEHETHSKDIYITKYSNIREKSNLPSLSLAKTIPTACMLLHIH
jgi:hypothetical protein